MADNVVFTEGANSTPPNLTTVATDEIASAHYQYVKLVNGTSGNNEAIPGDATNGLLVDISNSSLATTNALASQVDGHSVSIGATDDSEAAGNGSVIAILKRIRTLLSSTLTVTISGIVSVAQSGTWILGANSGVDIGDVTINNGNGASAVNIQDGGNSITVDFSKPSVSTTSSVVSSATNVTLLASNANRLGATIYNDSTQILYVKLGTTASSSSYTVQMDTNSYYEVPFGYTGNIDGIWTSANGNARIDELT